MSPPGSTESLPDFRDFASQIARTRNDFGRLYDEVRPAGTDTRSFMVVALGAMSDNLAFECALRQASEEGWFTQLAERLLREGFLMSGSSVVTQFQAVVSSKLGFTDASAAEKGALRARARLCRVDVEIEGRPAEVTGTGFLVGPSTVLTSFHVVSALVDDTTGRPKPDAHRQLTVRFDHATDSDQPRVYRVPEGWLVCSKRPHPAEVSDDGSGRAKLRAPAVPVVLDGYLDYAVLVIAGCPGAERGYYDLDAAVEPIVGTMVHLFQHPGGVQQRRTAGTLIGFRASSSGERIDHDANTLSGSSGGLLLDGDYALIGLHQGAYGNPATNTAIAAKAIREHIRAERIDLLDGRYAQAYRLADNSRPILGRVRCQEWIRRGPQPLVRVKPSPMGKGVTFTVDIMRACLSPSGHVIEEFSATAFPSDALRTAELLLTRLGVDVSELPTVAETNSTRGVWIGQLVTAFITRLAAAYEGRTIWLVIDDLEKGEHAIPDGSVQDFLSELYRRSSGFTNLRIVLLGLRDFPSGFPNGLVHNEDISPPQAADVASYVRYGLTVNGHEYSAREINRLTRLIMLSGGASIATLSDYVADKVDRMLDSALEDAW